MKKNILFLLLCLLTINIEAQTFVFVDAASDDDNSGSSWTTAKKTLQAALNIAESNTTIFVKVGTYPCPTELTIPDGVTIIGGYGTSSTGTDTTNRLYPGTNANWTYSNLCTIIKAQNSHRVATVNSGGKLVGCVLTDGITSQNGGGVYINGGYVQHCVIKDCNAIDELDQQAKGGGVYITNGGTLINCVVTGNHANDGAGVAGSNGDLINNTITHNYVSRNCGTVTDYDGNTYNTVVIGSQCWMKENYNCTHDRNGGSLSSYYCRSTPSGFSQQTYYQTTITTSNLCPSGWHIPNTTEINDLKSYLSSQMAYCCGENTNYTAKSLASTTGWSSQTAACTVGCDQIRNNKTGFSALPVGYFYKSSLSFYSSSTNANAIFLTTGTYNSFNVYCSSSVVIQGNTSYNSSPTFLSVRCLKD